MHASGAVRFALAEKYASRLATTEQVNPDRALLKWRRPSTPERGAVHALTLAFPTDYLLARRPATMGTETKPVIALPPAPAGQALEVGLFYSREEPASLEEKLASAGLPLGYNSLPSGEIVSIVLRNAPFTTDVTARLGARRLTLLNDELTKQAIGQSLDDLSAFLLNDPNKDGFPKVTQVSGLRMTKA